MFHHSCGCGCGCGCEQSCGCNSCGCDSCNSGCSSCNGGGEKKEGGEKEEHKPSEAGASLKPIPPRPMADPNASVGQQRNVVRTSFLR
jgi:hypothetical protein